MADLEELRRLLREAENRALDAEHQRIVATDPSAISRGLSLAQSCYSGGHLPFPDYTRRHYQSDRPNFSSTNHPWDNFAEKQELVWDELGFGQFSSQAAFPSRHQLEYVKSLLK